MKQIFLVALVLVSCNLAAVAQQPQQLTPTHAQHAKLGTAKAKVFHAEREIAKLQQQLSKLQSRYIFEAQQLDQASRQVIVENRWPSGTRFDQNLLMFSEPAPPPPTAATPAEPKKP